MSGLILFFKELKEFKRFRKIDKNKRKIVFYSEDIASHSYFEGLIDYLTNRLNLKVHYVTSDPNDPIFSKENKNIEPFYIKHLLGFFTKLLDSKMIIMTMPDLNQFHIKRSEYGANHIYTFHHMGNAFMVLRHGALDHYDTIFCVGPHQIKEIRRAEELYNLEKKKLVKCGYYKVEKIFSEYKSRKRKPTKYKARILVAPSWGKKNILESCGIELISILLKADYEVIVRPHPTSWIVNSKLLESIEKEFKDYENFDMERGIPTTTLCDADLLISDWSSVALEYAFGTERPVLYIDVPRKIMNPRYKEFKITPIEEKIRTRIGIVLGLDEIKNINKVVGNLLKNRDKYKEELVKARNEYVYNFGNSSRVSAEYIHDFCSK